MKAIIKGINFTVELEGDPVDVGITIGVIAGQNQERHELDKQACAEGAIIRNAAPPPPTPPPLRIVSDLSEKSESGKQSRRKIYHRSANRGGWTDEHVAILKSEKAKDSSDKAIGKIIGKSAGAVGVKASGLRKKGQLAKSPPAQPGKRPKLSNWSKEQEARFRTEAPHNTVPDLCRMFNCSEKEIKKRLVLLKNEG